MNIARTILKKSLEIYKQDGLKGLLKHRTDYYKAYPPIRKNLYYWLYSKLKIHKNILKKINGFNMQLNLNDYGLSKQLWISGFREPECVKHFMTMLNKDDVVLDIGANIGYYTLMEAKIVKQVYALEPLPENYKFLIANMVLNNMHNVTLLDYAISDHNGRQTLYNNKHKNRTNMFFGDIHKSLGVKCITVDSFCETMHIKPTVIRMDIEGFEYYAIDGMLETLKNNKCKLFFEIHPYQMEQQVLNWKKPLATLFNLGYHITAIIKEHGPIREETFYAGRRLNHLAFAQVIGITPDVYTHGFGLFMEKD